MVAAFKVCPACRRHAICGPEPVHQLGHQQPMGLYAHAPCTDIRPQKESAIVCGLLSLCNTPQTLLFEIERVGISLHAGHRSITRYLIIEEEAPVVAIGHGLLSVGKGRKASAASPSSWMTTF